MTLLQALLTLTRLKGVTGVGRNFPVVMMCIIDSMMDDDGRSVANH